jgi:hypothetical protein
LQESHPGAKQGDLGVVMFRQDLQCLFQALDVADFPGSPSPVSGLKELRGRFLPHENFGQEYHQQQADE